MEVGFGGRPAVLRVIWWGQRVPGAPGGGRRLRKLLPVVQVSAGEGNTMATGPAGITFSPTISQIKLVPSFFTPSLWSWPLPNRGSFPRAFPFLRSRNHLTGTHVPLQTAGIWARDLGHPSRKELPLEPLHREPVIRDARFEVLSGRPRHPFGLLHWDYGVGPAGFTEGRKPRKAWVGARRFPGCVVGESLVVGCWHPSKRDGEQGALWPLSSGKAALFRGLWQAQLGCDFTPGCWLVQPSFEGDAPGGEGWTPQMTRAGCGRREIAQAGQLRQSWDPDFNGALFFLGTVLTYIYTYIHTHTYI